MDYVCQKLRALRSSKGKSPKFRRVRMLKDPNRAAEASPSDSPGSRLTASPSFIDKIILGRPLMVKYRDEEGRACYSESDFVLDCLHWHNVYRERHGVPPLTLSYQLCNLAQHWANQLAHTDSFYHRNAKDIGENLFSKFCYVPDLDLTGEQVTRYWYHEIRKYDFYEDPSLLHVRAGHFTQLVWRSSTEFGIGKARTRCGKIIVVANYKPAGNVIGEFHDNVFPPLKVDDIEENDEEAELSS